MASNNLGCKPCKTCCIREVCIQSVISTAKCPGTKVQLNFLYGRMDNTELVTGKHTEPNK